MADLMTEAPPFGVSEGPAVGFRGVVLHDADRRYLNIVASPTASYLLPDLLPTMGEISLGVDQTRMSGGVVRLNDSMFISGSFLVETVVSHSPSGFTYTIGSATEEAALATGVVAWRGPAGLTKTGSRTLPSDEVPVRLAADASVQATASRIRALSGLSDAKLADVFQVTRETFNRWRRGAMTNPTAGTRRRLGMVLRLLEELSDRGVAVNDWLQNVADDLGPSPYDLLLEGKVPEVAYLVAAEGASPLPTSDDDDAELNFDDDEDEWELVDLGDADDEV
jgi:transcriptional regulator with XRE-family HTH domain